MNHIGGNGTCKICDSKTKVYIGKPRISNAVQPFIDKEYKIMQCDTCDYYFVDPCISFTEDTWQQLYSTGYFGKMTSWWARKRDKDRKNRFNRLEKHTKGKIHRFLDIGSGEGYFLMEAHGRGWETYGIDISDNRIPEAREKEINFIKGDIFNAHFPDNSFDCVYMDSVLEHVPAPLPYLREVARILRPGGVFYIGVPNEKSLFNDTRYIANIATGKKEASPRIKPFISPYHINGFTTKTLKVAAERTDFDIMEMNVFGGHYDFLKYPFGSKAFYMQVALLPIHLMALVLKKQTYVDAIFRKKM